LTDEKRIFQITSNLVSNAVKFTSEGKVDIRLSLLEIKENRGRICIEVEDTGIGITEDEKTLLFNEFSQLNKGTLEMQQGSGLGLSICKKFVNLLGGQIDVESKEGEGSVFWFDLPVVIEEQQPQDVQNEPVRLSREEDEKFKKTSILLVDDKVVNQKVIGLMLESMGCQVKYASNGQEALKIFQESQINAFNIFGGIHFDIIFLDIRMPILDGFQTIEQLRSNYSDLPPIVALSANSLPEEIAEYQEAGFEDYLIKPVTLEDLERIIKKWVVQKQKMQDLRSGKSNNELKEDFIKTPIVNKHTLDVILNTIKGDQGILFQLIDTFVEDMDRIHEKIQQAMATDDVASLQLLILTTKGLSGNMGASQLHEISMYIDKCFREEMTEKALEMIPFLMERYFILKTELSVYYSSLSLSNS
ncbi:MAG: response regulator, partial [Bacteroidales bacterium]|nr:response regulator [Bacteroidales bacterium]